jgi:hypothetical protein
VKDFFIKFGRLVFEGTLSTLLDKRVMEFDSIPRAKDRLLEIERSGIRAHKCNAFPGVFSSKHHQAQREKSAVANWAGYQDKRADNAGVCTPRDKMAQQVHRKCGFVYLDKKLKTPWLTQISSRIRRDDKTRN